MNGVWIDSSVVSMSISWLEGLYSDHVGEWPYFGKYALKYLEAIGIVYAACS